MVVRDIEDIIRLIAKRDGLSFNEASNVVDECVRDLHEALSDGNINELEDIVMWDLGLEPDYLEILLYDTEFI